MDLDFLYKEYKASSGISTDTRKIKTNEIFFALRGPNFNANQLAEEAIQKGARLAIIDDHSFAHLEKTYLVEDSLICLQQLAIQHRKQLNIPVFGLTGSNGKTTTKELLKAVLDKKYQVLATQGNLNNHIGVPLTILSIDAAHELAIIEMGANHLGEIAALCQIAQPSHGLITNIGKAHIGEFGGFENILRAKSELYDYLLKNGGQIFVNMLDPSLKNMSRRFENFHPYPKGEECNIDLIDANPFVRLKAGDREVTTKLIGSYNFPNMAAAYCVGKYFDVPQQEILEALQSYSSSNNRSQIIQAGSNTVILDAYNANPSSMEAALLNFERMKADKKIVILGDMLELGDETITEHKKVGELAHKSRFKQTIFVGPLMQSALEAFPEAHYFKNKKELLHYLDNNKITGSHILIKGSRGMALEDVLEALKAH